MNDDMNQLFKKTLDHLHIQREHHQIYPNITKTIPQISQVFPIFLGELKIVYF